MMRDFRNSSTLFLFSGPPDEYTRERERERERGINFVSHVTRALFVFVCLTEALLACWLLQLPPYSYLTARDRLTQEIMGKRNWRMIGDLWN